MAVNDERGWTRKLKDHYQLYSLVSDCTILYVIYNQNIFQYFIRQAHFIYIDIAPYSGFKVKPFG
jgi:hypothetical protein